MGITKCAQCRKPFQKVRSWQRFDSPDCRKKNYEKEFKKRIIAEFLNSPRAITKMKEQTGG